MDQYVTAQGSYVTNLTEHAIMVAERVGVLPT